MHRDTGKSFKRSWFDKEGLSGAYTRTKETLLCDF